MYYFVSCEKIVASNPNDMTGNSGWVAIVGLQEPIEDANGNPRYGYVNGAVMMLDPSVQMANELPVQSSMPLEQRVEYLEADTRTLTDAVNILLGGEA